MQWNHQEWNWSSSQKWHGITSIYLKTHRSRRNRLACGTPLPEETPIGMAYVPYQQWDTTFSAEEGFPKGTIFPQLYKPFCPGGERHA